MTPIPIIGNRIGNCPKDHRIFPPRISQYWANRRTTYESDRMGCWVRNAIDIISDSRQEAVFEFLLGCGRGRCCVGNHNKRVRKTIDWQSQDRVEHAPRCATNAGDPAAPADWKRLERPQGLEIYA